MSSSGERHADYYFVPLGREPGGYLDVLGMPPDASPGDIGARDSAYRKELLQEFKDSRRRYRLRLKRGQVTEAEYKAEEARLEQVKNDKEVQLNKLKTKFEGANSERRGVGAAGQLSDDAAWFEMYRPFFPTPPSHPYLEALSLPPDATPEEIEAADAAFRSRVAEAHESEIAGLPQPEEYDAAEKDRADGLKTLEKARDERLAELDKLRADYGRVCEAEPERRERLRDEFWRWLFQHRALTRIPQEWREEAIQKWITGRRRPPKGESLPPFSLLPSSRCTPSDCPDLTSVSELLLERDLLLLLAADALWGELKHTNRATWQEQLEVWITEAQSLGPHFNHDSQTRGAQPDSYFASCRRTDLTIDHLEADDMAEFAQGPQRGPKADSRLDLAAMLAALMGDGAEDVSGADPEQAAAPSADALLEFLARLAEHLREQTGEG